MLFPTFTFAAFFAVVLPLSWALRPRPRLWKLVVLGASYIFYGYWDVRFVALLVAMTMADHLIVRQLSQTESARAGKRWMIAGVAANLAVLGLFKYYGFFVDAVEQRLGIDSPALDLVLPVGISFFTFHGISYIVDTWRKTSDPVPLIDVALYIAFFPHMVAGPVVRPSEFMPALVDIDRPRLVPASRAVGLIARGVFKKVVISAFLADALVDEAFHSPELFSGAELLLAVYGYAIQIYADFSGYTDMAIGIALLMGVEFPTNFDRPYTAPSMQDFWRRWHMTLSRWLRDYLYFPLGGNRKGRLLTYRNLLITMTLGGLWHGAAGTFIVWGLLQGGALAAERLTSDLRGEVDKPIAPPDPRIRQLAELHVGEHLRPWHDDPTSPVPFTPLQVRKVWLGRIVTFHFVCLGWIFFRADSISDAGDICWRILTNWGGVDAVGPLYLVVVIAALAVQYVPPLIGHQLEAAFSRVPAMGQALALALWFAMVVALAPTGVSPFIYFQF